MFIISSNIPQKKTNLSLQYNKTISKMINYDDVTEQSINKHNLNWSQIPVIQNANSWRL